jgi:hypothetical protein
MLTQLNTAGRVKPASVAVMHHRPRVGATGVIGVIRSKRLSKS